ncbi:hypothetical protein B0H19DRAFT_1377471 [Mycena capillaripes]|nr:hypothetical protein B0H19DRAFT_1377471 [Mycena capillaripes]
MLDQNKLIPVRCSRFGLSCTCAIAHCFLVFRVHSCSILWPQTHGACSMAVTTSFLLSAEQQRMLRDPWRNIIYHYLPAIVGKLGIFVQGIDYAAFDLAEATGRRGLLSLADYQYTRRTVDIRRTVKFDTK